MGGAGGAYRRGLYLLLSGAEVATQRSFIMISIVLIGVMIDRTLWRRSGAVALRRVGQGAAGL